jgi:hypothetical protein
MSPDRIYHAFIKAFPEFEGKVTVAICRNDLFAKQSFVDENGDFWQ